MAISLGSGNNKIQILCTGHLGAKRSIGGSELLRRGEGNEWCALEESGCGGDGEFEEWHAVLLTAVLWGWPEKGNRRERWKRRLQRWVQVNCRKLNTMVKTILFSSPKKSTQRSSPKRSCSRKMIPRMWINKRLTVLCQTRQSVKKECEFG